MYPNMVKYSGFAFSVKKSIHHENTKNEKHERDKVYFVIKNSSFKMLYG